jgi:hypothetical protein
MKSEKERENRKGKAVRLSFTGYSSQRFGFSAKLDKWHCGRFCLIISLNGAIGQCEIARALG